MAIRHTYLLTIVLVGLFALPATAQERPPDAKPGHCYARYDAPAIIETVTERILVSPEVIETNPETGYTFVAKPAVYKTDITRKIISTSKPSWYQTICAKDLTPNFIQTLQRALAARKLYRGPLTGTIDRRTQRSIRAYQKTKNMNSAILAHRTAQDFGLVVHSDFLQ